MNNHEEKKDQHCFIKTLSYGLFELKYQNKIGGAIVVFVSIAI